MSRLEIIAKNTALLFSSQILTYILTFFYTIFIARYLGTDGFGILSLAIAFSGIFLIFSDLGLGTLTTRDVARDESLASKYVGNILSLKIILLLFTLVLLFLTMNIISYDKLTTQVIYVMVFSVIVGSFSNNLNAIFQAYEKMEYQSLGQIINATLMFIGVIIAIYLHLDVLGFTFIYLIANFLVLIYTMLVFIRKLFLPKIHAELVFWKQMMRESLPLGISSIFATLYVWIDSVMLSIIQGNDAVGIYNASYRLIIFLLFIPNIFNTALFPTLSKYHVLSKNALKIAVQKYFKLMIIISIPLGVGVTMLADRIILMVFGAQYVQSISSLQILIWSTVFIFTSTAFIQLFLSINRQITLTKIGGICLLVNILLNLILIPRFSYIGASIVTVLTELTVLFLILYAAWKIDYGISIKQMKELFKIIIASSIMGIIIFILKDQNLIILVLMSIIIYFSILIALSGFDKDDLYIIKNIIKFKRD